MKVLLEEVYEVACKIATNVSNSFGRNNFGNVLLYPEEFFGDMMIKLSYCITKDKFSDLEHFYKDFKIACVNTAKSRLKKIRNHQNVEDEFGNTHKIRFYSLSALDDEIDGIDMASTVEDMGGISALDKMIEEECHFYLKKAIREIEQDDTLVLDVFAQWINPDKELIVLIQKNKSGSIISYHKTVRDYLNISKDLYNYAKDLIFAKFTELYPDTGLQLGIV